MLDMWYTRQRCSTEPKGLAAISTNVDLYSSYRLFSDPVLAAVRQETFGVDFGQNSWLTANEFDRFIAWLDLAPDVHALEVACGSGGPAAYVAARAGCRVTGIDANAGAIETAGNLAADSPQASRLRFLAADATAPLPFTDGAFDALLCIDAMNHFADRIAILREWRRVLRPGRRALFTDPVVITGPVTNRELAVRSSIGPFLFVPPGVNDQLIAQAGLRLVQQEDATENAATIAARWREARDARRADLIAIEGERRFEELQAFFEVTHALTSQGRLSRIVYVVERT